MLTGRILVVDDEKSVLAAFQDLLRSRRHDVATAGSAEAGLAHLASMGSDLVILDICMPGMSGLEALALIKEAHPRLPIIVTTGRGTPDSAISAAKLGAFGYLLKPIDPAALLDSVQRALDSVRIMKNRTAEPKVEHGSSTQIIGHSPAMQGVYRAIGRVAPTDATVLVRGESGTGKELVARAIHSHSLRVERPLVVVNCVAIPETLLESELFGYERGAFTGATSRRIGKFEHAHGGTILLDEIGDTPLGIQAKILRVLQEKTIERIGGNDTLPVNVRLLAVTNRNLEMAIEERTFRRDLYHRLNVVTIRIRPLRERTEDIPALAEFFIDRFSQELGLPRPILTPAALDVLQSHYWPGNVRELEHCIKRAIIFTRGYPWRAEDVVKALAEGQEDDALTGDPGSVDARVSDLVREHLSVCGGHDQLLEKVEKLLLVEAMRKSHGIQASAASLLGLPRPTLHAKLRKYGVHLRG